MTPRLTDDEVSGLPLAEARAELLEEIMSTSLSDRSVADPARRPPRRWAAPLAAAAAVAVLVATPAYLLARDGNDTPAPADGSAPTGAAEPTTTAGETDPAADVAHEWLVLDVPGWEVVYSSDTDGWREVQYENGARSLQVSVVAARLRAGYVEDRQHIDHPEVDPGAPVQLAGADALMWPYSANDHTAIGVADQGVYPEVRGSGMGEDDYIALLAQLRWTDQAGFEASLPDTSVTSGERDDVVQEMLADVPVPPGWERPDSSETDRYQLGAAVTGSVACQWFDELARARQAGDQGAAAQASEAMSTARDWPVLQEMDAEGDYPEVIWEMADEAAAGRVPQGYAQALGCG